MPIYVYRCVCGRSFEQRRPVETRDSTEGVCPYCGKAESYREYTRPMINVGHSDDPSQDYQFKYLDDKERNY